MKKYNKSYLPTIWDFTTDIIFQDNQGILYNMG